MTVTLFGLIWLTGAIVGCAVYVWDWREARLDGQFMNQPPPGQTERRIRPRSRMIVRGDVLAAFLYLIGQVIALAVGIVSLWLPTGSAASTVTPRSVMLSLGVIGVEGMTSAGGVVRIYVRRWLRKRHQVEVAAAARIGPDTPPVAIGIRVGKDLEP